MGGFFALIIWLLALATVIILGGHFWWFPELISAHGKGVDDQFNLTFTVVGIIFFMAQAGLGYCALRYRASRRSQAVYSHGNSKMEAVWTIATAAVFIWLAILGQRVWAEVHLTESPPDAVPIEVMGQQFAWNIRYPGPDGTFGRTDPKLIDDAAGNYIGLDEKDPAARDDIMTQNLMAIPVNHPIRLILRSKDVTHSFFVPWLRLKQDLVPGMAVMLHFTANKTGDYEIACAELCGQLHWQMRGFLKVMSEEEFQKWLKVRAAL